MDLIASKEVVKKRGEDLSEIFYQSFFVRLWQFATNGFRVAVQRSGEGCTCLYFDFEDLGEAQDSFDRIEGAIK
jgi:hypothetical protein